MGLDITTIKNPHTNGRGDALLFRPHDSSSLAVRYDEYDGSPCFFLSALDDSVEVVSVDDHDEGCTLRFNCKDGEFNLVLGVKLWKFMNSLSAAVDEWAAS